MLYLLTELRRDWRALERPARLGMALGMALILLAVAIFFAGPSGLRRPVLAGVFGLALGMQVVFLWSRRTMLSDLAHAQRHFEAGEFEAVCALLAPKRAAGRASLRELCMLGNALRQRGLLMESETILRAALAQAPGHRFPLAGLGRTRLAQGHHGEAAELLRAALAAGAPDSVRRDLGQALRHGD